MQFESGINSETGRRRLRKDDSNLSTSDTSFHQWPSVCNFYLLLNRFALFSSRCKFYDWIYLSTAAVDVNNVVLFSLYTLSLSLSLKGQFFALTAGNEKADNDDVYIKNYTRYNCISPHTVFICFSNNIKLLSYNFIFSFSPPYLPSISLDNVFISFFSLMIIYGKIIIFLMPSNLRKSFCFKIALPLKLL